MTTGSATRHPLLLGANHDRPRLRRGRTSQQFDFRDGIGESLRRLDEKLLKKRGGARVGAGRKKGIPNGVGRLGLLRVPDNATAYEKKLAGLALRRVIDVMEMNASLEPHAVLKAAVRVREEICGPLVQRHEHAGPNGDAIAVNINIGARKGVSNE